MIRILFSILAATFYLHAEETLPLSPSVMVGAALLSIILFFWGIYKAVRTQNKHYAWALLPFMLLLTLLFFM